MEGTFGNRRRGANIREGAGGGGKLKRIAREWNLSVSLTCVRRGWPDKGGDEVRSSKKVGRQAVLRTKSREAAAREGGNGLHGGGRKKGLARCSCSNRLWVIDFRKMSGRRGREKEGCEKGNRQE